MDPLVWCSSLPEHAGSNALITTGIIIVGIIKRGLKKIQKSIQDTFCSGSENEGDGEEWGGRRDGGVVVVVGGSGWRGGREGGAGAGW